MGGINHHSEMHLFKNETTYSDLYLLKYIKEKVDHIKLYSILND